MNTHGYLNTRGYPHSGYPRGYGQGRSQDLNIGGPSFKVKINSQMHYIFKEGKKTTFKTICTN